MDPPPSGCNNESQHRQEENRLSALPDDILLNILERLSLRSAIQTTTLSRRWRYLPLMLTRLVLDVEEFFMERSGSHMTPRTLMTSFCKAAYKLLSTSSFTSRECAVVKDLRLIFYLADPGYLLCIGQAVSNAIKRGNGIEFLEFNIWPVIRPTRCSDEHLILFGQRFMWFLDACPNVFRWLTSLTLRRMQFGGEADIQNILNICHKLQSLALDSCDLNNSGSGVLKIDAPNSHLVALDFVNCYFSQVELICVPRLSRLVYDTWISVSHPLRFGSVPLLRSIRLGSTLMSWQVKLTLSGLLSNTRDLSALYLDFHDGMIWFQPEGPKKLATLFRYLKTVHLDDIFPECDLQWTLLFLEASPFLSSLYVKISRHMCGRNKRADNAGKTNVLCEASSFKHYNLNSLGVKGFAMEEKLINYIKLVIERAVALTKIYLYDKEPCQSCDLMKQTLAPLGPSFPIDEEEENLVRRQLTHGLSSSSIDIIIEKNQTDCSKC